MAMIILDFGSANTCRNDKYYAKRMLDELKAVDTGKHEIIIKWQFFKEAGDNIPLDREIFRQAYEYAAELGYKTTSSVFDKESLDFLLQFEIPFVKIANRRELDWLIGEVPRKIPICISLGKHDMNTKYLNIDNFAFPLQGDIAIYCVSNYPAPYDDYVKAFSPGQLHRGISDHTTCFSLFRKFEPELIEWHYGLPDSTGPDAGPFMRTPEMLAEVL
jgi:sialic acid synthase SpsE